MSRREKGVWFLVADSVSAPERWRARADIVVCAERSSLLHTARCVEETADRYPGAAAVIAPYRNDLVAACARGPARGTLLVSGVGSRFGTGLVGPGVRESCGLARDPVSLGPMVVRLLEVALAGLEVGEDAQDLGRVVR